MNMENQKDELVIECCKDKELFVENYLNPLLKASNSSIVDVAYEYYFNGDSNVDEEVTVRYADNSSLTINVSRDSKAQLVIDVVQVRDREQKRASARTGGG